MPVNPENPEERTAAAHSDAAHQAPASDAYSAMGFGMRAGAQFIGSAVGGGAIGWLIDRWLGTSPFGLLIVMILFFGAALVNVWLMMSKAVEDVTARIASGELPATEETKKGTDEGDGESA